MRVGEAESRRTGAVVVQGKCRRSQNNRESRMNFALAILLDFKIKNLLEMNWFLVGSVEVDGEPV